MVAATDTVRPVQGGLIRGAGAIWLLTLTMVSAAAMRASLSPLQEVVKLDLRLDDVQMSLVQGLAASVPVAVLSIPLGRLVDRANRVRLLFAMALIWSLGSLMTAFAQDFTVLFVARMLAGLGALCGLPAAISIAADLSPPDRRGRVLLFLSVGVNVGTALAFIAAGKLWGAWGGDKVLFHGMAAWRAVQLAFAAASLVLALPLLITREPARHEVGENNAPFGVAMRELWARRGWLIPLFIGQVGVVMADTAAGVWAAPLLTRVYGLTPAEFAERMGFVVLVPGLLGAVVGGLVADMAQKRGWFGGVLFGAVAASVLAIPFSVFAAAPGVTAFALMLAGFLFCGAIVGLVTAAAIAVLTPNETRGVTLGAFVVVGAVIGFGLAPTLVVMVSGALGGQAHLGTALAAVDLVVSLISCAAFVMAARTARADA